MPRGPPAAATARPAPGPAPHRDLDAFVIARAPRLLAEGGGAGCVRRGGPPGGFTLAACDRPARGAAAYVVAGDGAAPGAPPPGAGTWFVVRPAVVERHRRAAGGGAPRRVARYPGLHAPALRAAVDGAVRAAARGLNADCERAGTELAGLVVRDRRGPGPPRLTRWAGPAEALSVAPHCAGHRGGAGVAPAPPEYDPADAELLAEFHVHPRVPGSPFAPPSAADCYQLVLAAAKGEHNAAYVVAPEGVYACSADPVVARVVLEELRLFLDLNGVEPHTQAAAVRRCEQPIPGLLARHGAAVPHLLALMRAPALAYRDLVGPPGAGGAGPPPFTPRGRARAFVARLNATPGLGLRLRFWSL